MGWDIDAKRVGARMRVSYPAWKGAPVKHLAGILVFILLAGTAFARDVTEADRLQGATTANDVKETERLQNATTVLKEILGMPESIPKDLLDRAECVVVFPSVKKVAVGVGGSYGRGAMVCRTGDRFDGKWGAPAMFALEGGSIGFQLGG